MFVQNHFQAVDLAKSGFSAWWYKRWAHEDCTTEDQNYICQNCDDSDWKACSKVSINSQHQYPETHNSIYYIFSSKNPWCHDTKEKLCKCFQWYELSCFQFSAWLSSLKHHKRILMYFVSLVIRFSTSLDCSHRIWTLGLDYFQNLNSSSQKHYINFFEVFVFYESFTVIITNIFRCLFVKTFNNNSTISTVKMLL